VTDATAIPVNVFENNRELMIVAPMPGVEPEDISIDVTDDGRLVLRAAQHGEGQERIEYLQREWSYGPYEREVSLPYAVDAMRANVSYGNGVLTVTLPRADATVGNRILLAKTGHARGVAIGHAGGRGGTADDPPGDESQATTVKV
jgi:HSP20 family protein